MAHFWRLTPGCYWSMSEVDRAYMMAYYETRNAMLAVEQAEADRRIEKIRTKGRAKDKLRGRR